MIQQKVPFLLHSSHVPIILKIHLHTRDGDTCEMNFNTAGVPRNNTRKLDVQAPALLGNTTKNKYKTVIALRKKVQTLMVESLVHIEFHWNNGSTNPSECTGALYCLKWVQ